MENITKKQPVITPLEDINLEQISGGIGLDTMAEINVVKSIANSFIEPFSEDLASLESNLYYRKTCKVLESYDRSSKPWAEKCLHLANSWNRGNKTNLMTPEIASAGLKIEDPIKRAAFFSLPPDEMQKLLNGAG